MARKHPCRRRRCCCCRRGRLNLDVFFAPEAPTTPSPLSPERRWIFGTDREISSGPVTVDAGYAGDDSCAETCETANENAQAVACSLLSAAGAASITLRR